MQQTESVTYPASFIEPLKALTHRSQQGAPLSAAQLVCAKHQTGRHRSRVLAPASDLDRRCRPSRHRRWRTAAQQVEVRAWTHVPLHTQRLLRLASDLDGSSARAVRRDLYVKTAMEKEQVRERPA